MRTRFTWTLGLAATLLSQTPSTPALAQVQRGNVGQQVERQLLNNLGNTITGQPNYPYPNQPYNAYQGTQGGYGQPGYQPQGGPGYYPQMGNGYQQPFRPGYFPQQQPQGYYPQQPQGYYPRQQPQQNYYQQPSQQPATAQRYQLPAQYAGAAPGSAVSYGGANYVVNSDGTMSPGAAAPAQPLANAQRYQIPAQFAGTASGSVVNYGGAGYVINNDGTMSPYAGPAARSR